MDVNEMKTIVPDYYKEFKCIANKCKHTCCRDWEVEIDDDSLKRFEAIPYINEQIERGEDNHFKLLEGDICPFLREDGFCEMICRYGEDILCQTCSDHPRFRNFWEDRIEMGLGLVCEEACRLVLTREQPMKLEVLEASEDDTDPAEVIEGVDQTENSEYVKLPEDEAWLMELRDEMLRGVPGSGPIARLREYLIYRHIADALYDDRLEERIEFVNTCADMIEKQWLASDGKTETLIDMVRQFSYEVEYDEDVKEVMFDGDYSFFEK